ncbi:MAG: hypothetical protein ACE5JJ_04220 [Nitrospinota bacterium]
MEEEFEDYLRATPPVGPGLPEDAARRGAQELRQITWEWLRMRLDSDDVREVVRTKLQGSTVNVRRLAELHRIGELEAPQWEVATEQILSALQRTLLEAG